MLLNWFQHPVSLRLGGQPSAPKHYGAPGPSAKHKGGLSYISTHAQCSPPRTTRRGRNPAPTIVPLSLRLVRREWFADRAKAEKTHAYYLWLQSELFHRPYIEGVD